MYARKFIHSYVNQRKLSINIELLKLFRALARTKVMLISQYIMDKHKSVILI